MRSDALGLFWRDEPPVPKEKVQKIKRTPPEPVWLKSSYLPGLEDALAFDIHVMTDDEILQAMINKEVMLFDIECYENYFIASFRSFKTGHVFYFEMTPRSPLNIPKLTWALQNFTTVGFNSISYDLPITYLALAGKSNSLLKRATNQIIVEGWQGKDVLKQHKAKALKGIDHIDLIEVAPLRASLKIYGGRLHVPRMQDLPFHPDTLLSEYQIAIVRWYNINSDLSSTAFLYSCLQEHINLRSTLSNENGIDLRSKSDAQIAEAVIGNELTRRTGMRPQRPSIEIGTSYRYRVPHFIKYQSPLMNWALNIVAQSPFVVDETGSIGMPEAIKALKLDINGSIYRMGIGGLHSSESTVAHVSDEEYLLIDKDVVSYYPFIILNLNLFPQHLGPTFLQVYKNIVDRRIAAKARGDKVVADSLKITINGSFGKLGSKYSILYSPDLLIQVTVTGQLSLLMLIERLEIAGIHVVSANTDGIVIKCRKADRELMDSIVAQWEKDTQFQTEESRYLALYSRDVNNYIAIKQKQDKVTKEWLNEPDGTKCKGAYANPWANKKNMAERLHKNPTNTICVEAVEAFLTKGVPIVTTIRNCRDITKFVSVRTVKGGAVKIWPSEGENLGRTEFLGKSIRWYYAIDVTGEIVYATNGNKVPRSDGAYPLMDLPEDFPQNIDFGWYEMESRKILQSIGYDVPH